MKADDAPLARLRIREATEKGYAEVEVGAVFDASYPKSKTRRGRLQGGGKICPTITRTAEIYYFEGVCEKLINQSA